MASAGVNVFRYSALFCGVGYGIYHQSTINSAQKHHQQVAEIKHQESLYEKAKSEWARRTAPKSPAGDVISDPNDPKFDLEKYLTSNVGEGAK